MTEQGPETVRPSQMFVRELHDQTLVCCCRVDPTIIDDTLVGLIATVAVKLAAITA